MDIHSGCVYPGFRSSFRLQRSRRRKRCGDRDFRFCGGEQETSGETDGGEVAESKEDTADAGDETEAAAESDADMFTNRDCRTEYDESACVSIQLNGDSVSADSDSVNISGTTVTITEEAQAQAAVQMQQKRQLQKTAGSLPQRRRLRETAGRIFRRL